ncbi:cerebellin 18 [Sinocyclocheilus anshuiensis]|uniref:Complement C1q-like protein 4 n=1 Tax=Sinocyclocheilus anshuiensis TaxID=1608454 RepID=A0A671LKI0_9TELE|nr:PREDICTED: complement C1q-like protein 4 [Sinocyclocheilus anshuiensis]XP_016360988.1 PREDICTED: complement C1q-like protein 4 [Sinocyclocheilus anshuiensis]
MLRMKTALCVAMALSLFSRAEATAAFDLLQQAAVSYTGSLPCGGWDCECAFGRQKSCCCIAQPLFELEEATFIRMVGLWEGLSHLNSQIEELTAGCKIAFTAAMLPMSGCLGPFTSNVSISYQSVSLNQGNGYNPALGTFTAPHAGLYSFSFTAYSRVGIAGQRLYQKVQLMKNGQLMASSWEDNREDSEDSSTQTVLLQLRRGCQVYVELMSGRQLCGDTQGQNMFSGYLVYPFSEQ